MTSTLYRLAAFTSDPNGGNPAGVWIGKALPGNAEMQSIAKAVGYSETAFLAPEFGHNRTIRYFSPEAEVPFCGHATIASGVALGNLSGDGRYLLKTRAGEVPVEVSTQAGLRQAALTSVAPQFKPTPNVLLERVLSLLGWQTTELDDSIPAALAYAGAWHLVIAAAEKQRLDRLDYRFNALKTLMLENDLTTVQLIWRENASVFHSRNPFPVGGVVEDPATGAAAAALGGYLRDSGLIDAPTKLVVHQGEAMGRASTINVKIPESGGIIVSGTAVDL